MKFEIEGEYNTATIHGKRSLFDESCIEQIQEMVNHRALSGDGDIAIMPDGHFGAGAVVGFTMPVKNKIVPNIVGSDIGCGMYAANFGSIGNNIQKESKLSKIDSEIRSRIPTGFDVHDRNDYHMIDDFPWTTCEQKWDKFAENSDFDLKMTEVPQYPRDTYFTDLCERVGYDQGRAINSMGSLGGGNHYVELGLDEFNELWAVIHSGSRGIGAAIAQHWQERATNKTTMRKSIDEVPSSVREYMNDNWKPKASKIRDEFSGEDIQNKFDEVSQAIQEYGPSTNDRNTDLDYLEGEEAHGYIRDMIFAQTYASISRKRMMYQVEHALNEISHSGAARKDSTESVHNYIDFEDGVIRKGACSAWKGERLIVPFNMKYGTIIARGKGKSDWNRSSAHGAGRAMSRTAAEQKFSDADFDEQTQDVFMSKKPLDEIPGAYKDPADIEDALGDSVEVENRITPILSIKAE